MRHLILFLTLAACSDNSPGGPGDCAANDGCAAGEACVSGACVRLCRNDGDCPNGQGCEVDVCRNIDTTLLPEISGIDAFGAPESDPTKADHRVQRRFS